MELVLGAPVSEHFRQRVETLVREWAIIVDSASQTDTSFLAFGTFSGPFDLSYTNYAVARDGTHFIIVEVDPQARLTRVNIVLNRAEELKGLTAASRQ